MLKLPRDVLPVFLTTGMICIGYALHAGQDANWDQINYHVYDVYAFLHNRILVDVAPAQIQTWLNPFGQIPQYALMNISPPRLATVLLAALASLSASLIYFLAKASLSDKGAAARDRVAICLLAAMTAVTAPMFVSEIGTSFNDYLSSICIFVSLLCVFKGGFSIRSYALAGFMLGLALDIKLTNATFIIGWCVTTLIVEKKRFLSRIFASGAASYMAVYLPIRGAPGTSLFILSSKIQYSLSTIISSNPPPIR